ncbi:MAG: sulfotransferase domain-containing protein [Phycisphaerales bacterium]
MQIVWLASYPKSGNTWVRFLLYALLHGPPAKSIDVSKRIPDVHRPIPFTAPPSGPLYAKTHAALTDRHPHIDKTARAVYIVRHPKDVLLSGLNYRRLAGSDEKALPAAQYVRTFLAASGDPAWASEGYGSWDAHVRSWTETDRFPVHVVRYEDLKAGAPAQLRAIADFLGIDADDAAIERAAKASSFDALRALEVREKANASPARPEDRLFVGDKNIARKGVYFINSGKTGQSLDSIAPGLDDAFDKSFAAKHADLLERFGYNA